MRHGARLTERPNIGPCWGPKRAPFQINSHPVTRRGCSCSAHGLFREGGKLTRPVTCQPLPPLPAFQPFPPLLPIPPMKLAHLRRLSAGHKRLMNDPRTARNGELPGVSVDVCKAHVGGNLERDAGMAGERA